MQSAIPLTRVDLLYAVILVTLLLCQAMLPDDQPVPFLLIAVCIFLLGVPHGAADTLIFRHLCPAVGWVKQVIFGVCYLALTGVVVGLWVWSPLLFLAGLLILSARHFGEDLQGAHPWLAWSYGFAVVLCPALLWQKAVQDLFADLVGLPAAVDFATVSHYGAWLALATLAAFLATHREAWNGAVIRITGWSLITLICLQPMPGFSLYFCFWHSRLHLQRLHRLKILDASPATALAIALPMVMTAMGIGYIAYRFAHDWSDPYTVRLIFVGLGALTLPHMLLVATLERSR